MKKIAIVFCLLLLLGLVILPASYGAGKAIILGSGAALILGAIVVTIIKAIQSRR